MKINKKFFSLALVLSIGLVSVSCEGANNNNAQVANETQVSDSNNASDNQKEESDVKENDSTTDANKSEDKDVVSSDDQDSTYDYEADVVVIGGGASGLTAALKAQQDGASVIVVEANYDCGGHAATSEGQLHSGGYTSDQEKWDIEDSADLYYYDHTRGQYDGARYNDFDHVRSVSNSMVESYEFIKDNGVKVLDVEPMVRAFYRDGGLDGDSVGRMTYIDASDWENTISGRDNAGIGLTRPLEKKLRDAGVKFLMNYHMDVIEREEQFDGKVTGIVASYTPTILPGEEEPLVGDLTEGNIDETKDNVRVKANKAVIVATGGSTGNLEFRTMYDPRLGPEYDGLAGMPFSDQDASGEIAAMRVGASLTSLGVTATPSVQICTPRRFGTRYGYGGGFNEKSKVWPLVVNSGIIPDFESLIVVNMLGQRVGNEDQYNAGHMRPDRYEFFKNSMTSVVIDPEGDGNAQTYGGPLWAIFDQDSVEKNGWTMDQDTVDFENGYAFKADTLEELAEAVVNKYYEDIKMDPQTLVDQVKMYNEFVDKGVDEQWGRENLVDKIENGPFYAVWATPSLHDTIAGLRVDEQMQVVDLDGEIIPGLFACGESTGGMAVHGLGRVLSSGFIAGRGAASVDGEGIATADTALKEEFKGPETNHRTKTDNMSYFSQRGGSIDTMTHSEKEAELKELADKAPEKEENEGKKPEEGTEADDNVFEGTSQNGYGGKLVIAITVEEGKITDIEFPTNSETAGIGATALEELAKQAIKDQTADVDAVSGSTITSAAFKEALANAMEAAGIKE